MTTCAPCANAADIGSWGKDHKGTHCRGCHRSWTSRAEVHCWTCHFHFGSHGAADLAHPHDSHGNLLHLNPAHVRDKDGNPRLALTKRPPGDVWGGLPPAMAQSGVRGAAFGASERGGAGA